MIRIENNVLVKAEAEKSDRFGEFVIPAEVKMVRCFGITSVPKSYQDSGQTKSRPLSDPEMAPKSLQTI